MSPESVDEALGPSTLLDVDVEGAEMIICGLTCRKGSNFSGDDQDLFLDGQSLGEPGS